MTPVGNVGAAQRLGSTLVSRRPVHGPAGEIDGFELHFGSPEGSPDGSPDGVADGEEAVITATLLDVFSRFNAADLLGGRPGYVNLTRSLLVGRLPVPTGPETATLLIGADVLAGGPEEPDAELAEGLARLVRSGYAVALDRVPYSPALTPLLQQVTLATVDVGTRDWTEALDDAQRYRAHGVRLLAKGVTSAAQLDRCLDAGFELFEGDRLDRDASLDLESLRPNQTVALELVGRLSDPDTSMTEVENLVRHSPELAFRLLRIANSASSGSNCEVSSLHTAIVMVGAARLRSWMLLISLSSSPGAAGALIGALTRAAACERVARASGKGGPESAFTLGLLDGVGDALGIPPGDLLARIPALAGELAQTLLGRPGPLRQVLDAVVGYQRGLLPDDADLPHALMLEAYLEALAWTTETSSAVSA